MAFERLKRLAQNIINLDLDKIVFTILSDPDVQKYIIELNTKGQLFEGVDALGVSLDSIGGAYSGSTVQIKRSKGQPFDRVTLFDKGDFYKSFDVDPYSKGFNIKANTKKGGDDLQDRWGDNLVGLNKESRTLLVNRLRVLIVKALEIEIKR